MPFVISPSRLTHITVGDQSGGGHMAGAAGNGTKFPSGWGPVEIKAAILHIAPAITNWQQQPHGIGEAAASMAIITCRKPTHPRY